MWQHLFRGGLFAESISQGVRRPVRADVLSLHLRESRKDLYVPYTMTTNNREWDRAWFYLPNDGELLPSYTGTVLVEKPDSWGYKVSPLERQARLRVYTDALRHLANKGLTAAIVFANFHRRRVLPLMETRLPLFKMIEEDPSKGSRMMAEMLSREIATQRAGRTVAPPPVGLGDLWEIKMCPDEGYIQLVSFVSRHRLSASFFFS